MEHAGAKTLDNWYANRALPFPTSLRKLAVIAPDTSPGLAALRQRLAQRASHPLRCDHYAAGFNPAGSASLEQAFEQLRIQHAIDPYDLVLLVDGSADALGIAESNGIIPGQVSRTPAPVWTAIGEDDANTELGDVANRVFASVFALIEAMPLAVTARPDIARSSTAANDTAATAMREPAAEAARPAVVHLPVLAAAGTAAPAAATGTHPLVLCAAGAVILASFTAMAAMLGWLPNQQQGAVATPAHAVASTAPAPTATPVALPAPASPSPVPAPALAAPSEPTPEPAATPASPQTRGNEEPDGAPLGTVAALGAAGLAAAAPRKVDNSPPARAKRPVRRTARPAPVQESPRQVGSNEVPVVEFVGTKTREQVIAEMMQARRAAARQASRSRSFGAPDNRILPN
ncbi:hypothetical protein [Noviherbaspirillum soli]|uniref:hypothetical protein n=1 Tax=Noviherbaspirillum soli TaxID=1064518 RepID=UPI00188BAE24|nr:hypothetical protein [Noviherbaspirillum soli]